MLNELADLLDAIDDWCLFMDEWDEGITTRSDLGFIAAKNVRVAHKSWKEYLHGNSE